MNRSKLIISRSGYSTMMDLVELGKKALLVPTPGQTEQEYLSEYHNRLGSFFSVSQSAMDLARDIKTAKSYSGFKPEFDTKQAVENFMSVISN